jgi:hypothetical protein
VTDTLDRLQTHLPGGLAVLAELSGVDRQADRAG